MVSRFVSLCISKKAWRFGGMYRLLQCGKVLQARNLQQKACSNVRFACRMMEPVCCTETWPPTKLKRCHNPEDHNMIIVHMFSRCMSCYFSCLISGCKVFRTSETAVLSVCIYISKNVLIKALIVKFLYGEYFILRKKIVFDLTFLYYMYVFMYVFLRFCSPYLLEVHFQQVSLLLKNWPYKLSEAKN
jgi:hypothetical protein